MNKIMKHGQVERQARRRKNVAEKDKQQQTWRKRVIQDVEREERQTRRKKWKRWKTSLWWRKRRMASRTIGRTNGCEWAAVAIKEQGMSLGRPGSHFLLLIRCLWMVSVTDRAGFPGRPSSVWLLQVRNTVQVGSWNLPTNNRYGNRLSSCQGNI